jgi:hypothetical protein
MSRWKGHLSHTNEVLHNLLLRATRSPQAIVSDEEQAFASGCEFWSATARRRLRDHLGRAPVWRLTRAERFFGTLGAPIVVRCVHRNVKALVDAPVASTHTLRRVAQAIEVGITPMAAEIDALLASFATDILRSTGTAGYAAVAR